MTNTLPPEMTQFMTQRRNFVCRLAASILTVVLGNACAQSGSPGAKPRIYDTGYEIVLPLGLPALYWVDTDHLLFVGQKTGRGPRPDMQALYVWDASTKGVTFHAESRSVCVADGVVRYPVRGEAARKRVVYTGPLGAERAVEIPPPSKQEQGGAARIYSNFTCTYHRLDSFVPAAQRFNDIVVLRQGDGYLDLGPSGGSDLVRRLRASKKNLVLYQASGKAVELPVTWDEQFSQSRVTFSAYRSAYILAPGAPRGAPLGMVGPWPKGMPFVVYVLRRDGRVEKVSIPYFATSTVGVGDPQPTKSGWIFGAGDFYRSAGLYLFDGNVTVKLDSGAEQEIAVAPDGCKAAVAIQNDHLRMGTPANLRVFDFCDGTVAKTGGQDIYRPSSTLRRSASILLHGLLLAGGFITAQAQSEDRVTALGHRSYPMSSLPSAHVFRRPLIRSAQPEQGLVWLDNRRIMFSGGVPGDLLTNGLYIWDTADNSVKQYSAHQRFCYSDGYISAFGPPERRSDENRTAVSPVRQGILGHTTDGICDSRTGEGCPGELNMSCRPVEYRSGRPPLSENDVIAIQLRSGDGVLVTKTRGRSNGDEKRGDQPVMLLNERYPIGMPLPILAKEGIGMKGAAYSDFANRYVLVPGSSLTQQSHSTAWPQGLVQPIYQMAADGEIQAVQVPPRRDWNRIQLATLAAPGLVFLGSGGYENERGGVFLYDKHEVYALDRGYAGAIAVSPDGCSLAYAIAKDYGKHREKGGQRVKLIRLCENARPMGSPPGEHSASV